MPIACWLKIRNRISKEFVLRHLAYALGAFSDTSKYKIYIYNEDFNLPKEYYDAYTVLNRDNILQHPQIKDLHHRIEKSKLAECWKGAAKALASCYFYPHDCEYVLNHDSDDFFIPGPIT